MKRRSLFIFLSMALVLLGGFWLTSYLEFMSGDTCGNDVLEEMVAPEGSSKAVKFQRDCGATTGLSTQISILATDTRLPNDGGNVFIADTDHGKAPFGRGGEPELVMRWVSSDSFLIEHHPLARIFYAAPEISGINVQYKLGGE